MAKFKVGDIVELNSGGPKMTVSRIAARHLYCCWFTAGKRQEACFPPATLRPATDFVDDKKREAVKRLAKRIEDFAGETKKH